MHGLAAELDSLPRDYDKSKKGKQLSRTAVNADKEKNWALIFDMKKIHAMASSKLKFRYFFLTDGVSVSLLYNVPPKKPTIVKPKDVKAMLDRGLVDVEAALDPGMNMKIACVQRNVHTGQEVIVSNIIIHLLKVLNFMTIIFIYLLIYV